MRFSGELQMKKLRHCDERFFHYLCGGCCGNYNDVKTATKAWGTTGSAAGEAPPRASRHASPQHTSARQSFRHGDAGARGLRGASAAVMPTHARAAVNAAATAFAMSMLNSVKIIFSTSEPRVLR
jgi:uncharacterized membrane protein